MAKREARAIQWPKSPGDVHLILIPKGLGDPPIGQDDKLIMELDDALRDGRAEEEQWHNMVAVLCRDGGQYLHEHGVEQTKEHIIEQFHKQGAENERLQGVIGKLLKQADLYEKDGKPGPRGFNCPGWQEIARVFREAAKGEGHEQQTL